MASKVFGSRSANSPHLVRPGGGMKGEIFDLRQDIDAAFSELEGDSSGTTAHRTDPAFTSTLYAGFSYYDTDLTALYLWNGSAWEMVTKRFLELRWRIVVRASGPLPPHSKNLADPSLAALKSTTFALTPIDARALVGQRLSLQDIGAFIGDPGDLLALGLGFDIVDTTTGTTLFISTAIGGTAANPATGQPPLIGDYGTASQANYGSMVTTPELRIFTLGAAKIVGTVDMTTLTYGPGGDLDGQPIIINSDLGGISDFFGAPASETEVADQINTMALNRFFALVDASHHLVLYSSTLDQTGHIDIPAGATATTLGFNGGASQTDGRPTFGTLDPSEQLDATISIFVQTVDVVDG